MWGIAIRYRLAVSLLVVCVFLAAAASVATAQDAKVQNASKLSVSFYQGYEKDNRPMSNPVESGPLDSFYIGGVRIFESTVAVNVTGPNGLARGASVSLKVWNNTSERVMTCVANSAGCAIFYFVGPVPPALDGYNYKVYLTGDRNVTTETRKISFNNGFPTDYSSHVYVTLNRLDIVLNDRGEEKYLRANYTITPDESLGNTSYELAARDYFSNLYNERLYTNLTKNKTVYVTADIPLNRSNLYEIVHTDLWTSSGTTTGYHNEVVLLMLPMETTAPLAGGICDPSIDLVYPGLRTVESGSGVRVSGIWPMLPTIEGGTSRLYSPQPPGTEPELWNYAYFGEMRNSANPLSSLLPANNTTFAANTSSSPPVNLNTTTQEPYVPPPPPSIPEPSTFVIASLGFVCLIGYVLYARRTR